jgi:hypothetical protein
VNELEFRSDVVVVDDELGRSHGVEISGWDRGPPPDPLVILKEPQRLLDLWGLLIDEREVVIQNVREIELGLAQLGTSSLDRGPQQSPVLFESSELVDHQLEMAPEGRERARVGEEGPRELDGIFEANLVPLELFALLMQVLHLVMSPLIEIIEQSGLVIFDLLTDLEFEVVEGGDDLFSVQKSAFLESRLHLIDEGEGGLNVFESSADKVDE